MPKQEGGDDIQRKLAEAQSTTNLACAGVYRINFLVNESGKVEILRIIYVKKEIWDKIKEILEKLEQGEDSSTMDPVIIGHEDIDFEYEKHTLVPNTSIPSHLQIEQIQSCIIASLKQITLQMQCLEDGTYSPFDTQILGEYDLSLKKPKEALRMLHTAGDELFGFGSFLKELKNLLERNLIIFQPKEVPASKGQDGKGEGKEHRGSPTEKAYYEIAYTCFDK
jgi:hypothetical protein